MVLVMSMVLMMGCCFRISVGEMSSYLTRKVVIYVRSTSVF